MAADDRHANDRSELLQLAHETLRENLRIAVEGVLADHFRDARVREALGRELRAAIDEIVDDHITAVAASQTDTDADIAGQPARLAVPVTVEDGMARLQLGVRKAVGGRRPGLKTAATAAVRLTPVVARTLSSYIHDEAALAQAQRAAEVLLSRYLHPLIARQVVGFAATAARRSAPQEDDTAVEPPRVQEP